MKENPVREKSYRFALRVLQTHGRLKRRCEIVPLRQMLRAGTSIGANVEEALAAHSRRDFLAKITIASKEARECHYWLRLLRDTYPAEPHLLQLYTNCDELVRLLTAIAKSTRERALQTRPPQLRIQN